jgi:hypothetical protein
MGRLVGSSSFFKPGPPAPIGFASESIMTFLNKNVEGKILDLGGGRGAYSFELQQKGFDVTLGEIDKECIKSVRDAGLKAIDLTQTSLDDLKEQFDTVMLLEVLEHIPDYREFLQKALACSRSKVILTVPCNDDFEELFRLGLTYNHIAVSDHVNHFSSRDMKDFLEDTGMQFNIERGDFLFSSSIAPLVVTKLKRHPLGIFIAVPLKILWKFGWLPKLFPSRLFIVIKKNRT